MPISSMRWAEYTWKNELQMHAERVLLHIEEVLDENFQQQHSPLDMLERAVTLAAFSMRRMIEKRLITDSLAARVIKVSSFPAKIGGFRAPFHGHSGGRTYSNYHFDQPQTLSMKVKQLADEIIHSSQLMVISGDDQVDAGLLIASDWNLEKRLLHLTPNEFMTHVRAILDDRVARFSDMWDPESGKVISKRD